jgi:rubrerythrin
VTAETLILGYVIAVGGAIGGLALYEEFRRRSFDPATRPDHVFRCDRCGAVYTDDPTVDRSRCPGCGRTNEPYHF